MTAASPKILIDLPTWPNFSASPLYPVHVAANDDFVITYADGANPPSQSVFDTACHAFLSSLISQGYVASGSVSEIRGTSETVV